jgi:hypothetical protein
VPPRSSTYASRMAKRHVYGMVSAEQWLEIGRKDDERRSGLVEHDIGSSLLTSLAALLTLAMLTIGPMWTLIAVVGSGNEHGPAFEKLWIVPVLLTLAAAVPLALAIRRETSRARLALGGLLVVSLAIQLAVCPWF